MFNNTANAMTWLDDCYPNPTLFSLTNQFKNPFNGRDTKVTVWQTESGTVMFTVRACANSDYSYTGCCVNCRTLKAGIDYVNELYNAGKLFK